jgi:hypothetical protein
LERKARFPALRAGNAPKFLKKIRIILHYRSAGGGQWQDREISGILET